MVVVALFRWWTVRSVRQQPSAGNSSLAMLLAGAYSLAALASVPQLFVWQTFRPYAALPDWHQCLTVFAVRQ